ncbi:unnamed protein product [Urochloa decumbens]|uniref:Uncharacterized protein n=1 Tax=Urochloa decumbens TaxID=240449 RepID=A0ABC9GA22_9POAL
MMDEAMMSPFAGHTLPTLSQRSVEPTVTNLAGAAFADGEQETLPVAAFGGITDSEVHVLAADGNADISVLDHHGDVSSFSPQTAEPMFGNLFDLNQEWGYVEPDEPRLDQGPEVAEEPRPILSDADGRLNKIANDPTSRRSGSRGLIRLAVPLRKSLLCTPVPKLKPSHNRKNVEVGDAGEGKSSKQISFTLARSVDEKATILLMKASGIIADQEQPDEIAYQQFGTQFAQPMQPDLVGGMRVTFDLPDYGGADKYSALLCDATEDDAC